MQYRKLDRKLLTFIFMLKLFRTDKPSYIYFHKINYDSFNNYKYPVCTQDRLQDVRIALEI